MMTAKPSDAPLVALLPAKDWRGLAAHGCPVAVVRKLIEMSWQPVLLWRDGFAGLMGVVTGNFWALLLPAARKRARWLLSECRSYARHAARSLGTIKMTIALDYPMSVRMARFCGATLVATDWAHHMEMTL